MLLRCFGMTDVVLIFVASFLCVFVSRAMLQHRLAAREKEIINLMVSDIVFAG